MTLGNLSGTEIELLVSFLVNHAEIKCEQLSENNYSIVSKKKVIFGVNLASLIFDRIAGNPEIGIVSHDKHLAFSKLVIDSEATE